MYKLKYIILYFNFRAVEVNNNCVSSANQKASEAQWLDESKRMVSVLYQEP